MVKDAPDFQVTVVVNTVPTSDNPDWQVTAVGPGGSAVIGPNPATTVTGPDSFGGAAQVGTGTHYARNDHDHGLPSLQTQAITGMLSAVLDANAKAVLTSIISAMVNATIATNGTT